MCSGGKAGVEPRLKRLFQIPRHCFNDLKKPTLCRLGPRQTSGAGWLEPSAKEGVAPLCTTFTKSFLCNAQTGRKMKKLFAFALAIAALMSGILAFFSLPPEHISDASVSGIHLRSQVWSGQITVTGDTLILRDLSILPGTIVRFMIQDDRHSGEEVAPDGFNDNDPTRLAGYAKTHASLTVEGKLIAIGTPDKRILFTSGSQSPSFADWESIDIGGDRSVIEYATVEYSRNGITPLDKMQNSVFSNNIIRYALWGCISGGKSSPKILDNEIYQCGHEGIDVNGGSPLVENNLIYDSHAGIVILKGSPIVRNNYMKNIGDGIHVEAVSSPLLENNKVELAPENYSLEWRYNDFAYTMLDRPVSR